MADTAIDVKEHYLLDRWMQEPNVALQSPTPSRMTFQNAASTTMRGQGKPRLVLMGQRRCVIMNYDI